MRDLKSFKQESSTIKGTLIHQIEEAKQAIAERKVSQNPPIDPKDDTEEDVDTDTSPVQVDIDPTPPKKLRKPAVVHKETITPNRIIELNSEEEIDEYLNEMRKKLKNYLDNADYIKLI